MFRRFIRHPQAVFLRRAVFQIHLWTGVAVGLYVLMISLSGSVLVFERDFTNDAPDAGAEIANARPVVYEDLLAAVLKENPTYELDSVDMRSRKRRVVSMTFKEGQRKRVFYFDGYTGGVIRKVDFDATHGTIAFLESLHNELLGGRRGAVANGIGGLILALLCVTGIILWWPGKRVWKRALTINWRARWRRINFDLHSSVGFWTLAVLSMWAVTGAYFIFPDAIQKPLRLYATPAAAKTSTWKPGGKMQPLDSYVKQAVAAFPDEQLAYVYMDVLRPAGQVQVYLSRDPSVSLTLQEEIVRFDPGTATVLFVESSDRWSLTEKILMATYSIHFGDFGGTVSKIIWSVLSLSLSLLTVTGYLMWWNRLLRKKWARLVGPSPIQTA